MKAEDIFASEERLDRSRHLGGGTRDDGDFIVLRQVIHDDIEHEAIQLRFGERISAFHFDRVLSRENEERFLEDVAHAGSSDLVLLHGFQ